MKKLTASFAVLCALLFSAAYINAAKADTIYGCVDKASGALRIVAARTRCRSSETRISWNNIQGMHAIVHGMVNMIAGGGQITPQPPTFTVTHTAGTGAYRISFTPNPFTPSAMGTHGFDNAPTCLADSRNNPMGSACTANVSYDTTTGAWNANINCRQQDGTAHDADFVFACFQ
jgi:hypothetical protein